MFRHGEISTEVDKKPFVFTLCALLVCIICLAALIIFGRGDAMAIFGAVMMAVVTLAAGSVLFAMVSDYAYINDQTLYISYLFKKKEISLKQIGKIRNREDTYEVYDRNGNLVGTINGMLTGIDSILYELDKNSVNFE